MHSDNGLAQIESKPQTSLTIRFALPSRVEQIKQVAFDVIRNSRAVIGDSDLDGISLFCTAQFNMGALGRVLNGIVHNIDDDTPDQPCVHGRRDLP